MFDPDAIDLRELEPGILFRFANVPDTHTIYEYRGSGWYSLPERTVTEGGRVVGGHTAAGPYHLEGTFLVRLVDLKAEGFEVAS